MKMPYTKSGKCAGLVWQRNRYGQICYPAFSPVNPNTPAQRAVRGNFGAVSKRWRTLTQPQRDVWCAVARTKWSRPRLGKGRLPGFNYFVKTNVPLADRGQAQVDLPLEYLRLAQQALSIPFYTSQFGQPPLGPMLFLQANHLIDGCRHDPRQFATGVSPPAC
jgi:hypothetical protein